MHELSLCHSLLEEVERVLADFSEHARVTSITLRVGSLRAVIPETMQVCFAAARRGTRAEHATLKLEDIPAVGDCAICAARFLLSEPDFTCPLCRAPLQIVGGTEIILQAVTVEEGGCS